MFTEAAKNRMLDLFEVTHLSLHTGEPGSDGTQNEVPGDDYERKEVTFLQASEGKRLLNKQTTFKGSPGTKVRHVGFWEKELFVGAALLEGDDTFGEDGRFYLSSATQLTIKDSEE